MQIHEFKVGDRVQWLQLFDGVEYPVTGVVELVKENVLTVRDNLGQFWQVEESDYPKPVWD